MAQETILLTGATGNVGGVILEHLLSTTSHNINIVVRKDAVIPLFKQKYAASVDRFTLTTIPDMAVPNAFDEAAASATAIIHAATPLGNGGDWVKSMIEPTWAIDHNILSAAQKSHTVKRVIICGTLLQALNANVDLFNPEVVVDEKGFNEVTFEEARDGPWRNAYMFSKTNAERKTWAWVKENEGKVGFDVVMLLPPAITGRSPQVGFKPSADGPGGIPRIYHALLVGKTGEDLDSAFPIYLDTDDVARAHVLSLDRNRVPGNERYLLAASGHVNLRTIAARMRKEYPELKDRLPDVPEAENKWKNMVKVDTSKSDAIFGTEWRNAYDSVKEIVLDVVRWEKENGGA